MNSYGYWGKGEERSGLNGEEKQLALSVIKESVEVKTMQKHPLQSIMRKTASFYSFHLYLKEVMRGDIEISTTFYMKTETVK